MRIPLQHCPAQAGAAFKARDVLSCPGKGFTCLAFHLHPWSSVWRGFPPWVATAECVISLSSDEHLPSYPEKLRLCHGAIMSCFVGCSRNCLTPVGGSSLGLGAGPWWDMEVTDTYCATLGLRVVGCWLFFLDWNKKLQCCSWGKPKAYHCENGEAGEGVDGGSAESHTVSLVSDSCSP